MRYGWFGIWWRVMVRCGALGLVVVVAGAASFGLSLRGEQKAIEIFHGVTYECRKIPGDKGTAYLVRVDLKEPGVEVYVTPKDPKAEAAGQQYVTRWLPRVAREEGLAVAINGPLFNANWRNRIPGGYARAVETMVSNHEISHVWGYTYLMWIEDDLSCHFDVTRHVSQEMLQKAKWGFGAQNVHFYEGKEMFQYGEGARNHLTLIGTDPENKLLFFGAFVDADCNLAVREMIKFGAKVIIQMDSGSSTGMTIGPGARGVGSGAVAYPYTAIPVFVGVRAKQFE